MQHKVGPRSSQRRRRGKQRAEDREQKGRGKEERKIDTVFQNSPQAFTRGLSVPACLLPGSQRF